MSSSFRRLGSSELLPRYIFAEALFARRRVLEIGAVASTDGVTARFLASRGARLVVACDSDLAAVEQAQLRYAAPNLRYRANVFDDLDPASFDLVIISDLSPYVRAPELLNELVRLLSSSGYLMGGLRNPAGLALSQVMDPDTEAPPSYGQLLDALSAHFKSVEVATQSPVLGYQLAFEKGEGLQVDGSLVSQSEAAYYVALAGSEPARNFDPTWVQLPPEPLAYTSGRLDEYVQRVRQWEERGARLKEALGQARTETGLSKADALQFKEALEEARGLVSTLTAQLESASARPQVEQRQDELTAKVRRLQAELEAAHERVGDADRRTARAAAEGELSFQRAKEASEAALSAQEQARLESARRQQLLEEIAEARERLARAFEETSQAHDETAGLRVELERLRLEADRASAAADDRQRALESARARELRLADQLTDAGRERERIEGELSLSQRQTREAADRLLGKDAEIAQALRGAELGNANIEQARSEATEERARRQALLEEIQGYLSERAAAQTELAEAHSAVSRLTREFETLSRAERTTRELAQQLERRLAETIEQGGLLEAELSMARSRAVRLEKELETSLGAERSAREQAEVSLKEARSAQASLEATVEELRRARQEQVDRASELSAQVGHLKGREETLTRELEQRGLAAKRLEGMLEESSTAQALAHEALLAARDEATKAERRGGELTSLLESARQEIAAAGEKRIEDDQQLAQAREEGEAARRELQATRQQAEGLRGELENARKDSEGVWNELERSLKEAEGLRRELETARQHIDGERREGETARLEREAARRESAEQLAAVREQFIQQEHSAAELAASLEQSRRELAEKLGAAQGEGQRAAELERQLSQAKNEAQAAVQQLTGLQQAVHEAQQAHALLEVEFERAKAAKVTADEEARSRQEHQADLSNELLGLRVKYREAESVAERAQVALQSAQTEVPALRDQLEALEADRRLLDEERSRYFAEIERLEGERAQFGSMAEDLAAAQETLSYLRDQNEALIAEVDRLHAAAAQPGRWERIPTAHPELTIEVLDQPLLMDEEAVPLSDDDTGSGQKK